SGPDIQIWPTFKAVLSGVSLSDWDDKSRRPVLDAETVELELSAIAALQGNVVFSRAKLVRPVLYVSEVSPNRYAPVAPKIGRIWHGIEGARAIVAENPSNPQVAGLANDSFGTVEFSDGRVVDPGRNDEPLVTGLAGAVEWSALNSAGNLSANGIWRG